MQILANLSVKVAGIAKSGVTADARTDVLTIHAQDVFDEARELGVNTIGTVTLTESAGSPQSWAVGNLIRDLARRPNDHLPQHRARHPVGLLEHDGLDRLRRRWHAGQRPGGRPSARDRGPRRRALRSVRHRLDHADRHRRQKRREADRSLRARRGHARQHQPSRTHTGNGRSTPMPPTGLASPRTLRPTRPRAIRRSPSTSPPRPARPQPRW